MDRDQHEELVEVERRDAERGAARRLHEVVAPRGHCRVGAREQVQDTELCTALLSTSTVNVDSLYINDLRHMIFEKPELRTHLTGC